MRLRNTLKNLVWNFMGQLALILAGLLVKRVLLQTIGTEKIGLNYLFTDVVGLLSIAELGLTSIIGYHLYEPLANKDEIRIIKIMGFYRRAYHGVGGAVILIGIAMMPFLNYIVGDTTIDDGYIRIAFLLFILRTVEAYFFSYKSILPNADQKAYIILIIETITTIIHSIISVFVILYTKNYLYVLFLEIIKKVINDLIMIQIVNRRYPYIKDDQKISLEREEIKIVGRNIKDAFLSKASRIIVLTTDNIVMSVFLGLRIIGLFSNYTLVLYTIQSMLNELISSAQASIGNLMVKETEETVYFIVKKMTFISFFLVSICGCCLFLLTTPFISIFFGSEYIMNKIVVLICVFNIYLDIMQKAMIQLSDAGGLFRYSRRINITSCLINVVLSLIGVNIFGIAGVLLATLFSRMIEYSLRIRTNFRQILKISSKNYLLKIILFLFIFILELCFCNILSSYVHINNPYIQFIVYAVIAGMIPLIINTVIFYAGEEYQYMLRLIRMLLDRVVGR